MKTVSIKDKMSKNIQRVKKLNGKKHRDHIHEIRLYELNKEESVLTVVFLTSKELARQ